jgi:hypothetical protein
MQDQPDTTQAMGIVAAVMAVYAVIILVAVVAVIIPTWFICKKAGFSPWLSLLVIVPFGGLVLLYVLAFGEWKVVPAPQAGWQPQPPYPPQPPYTPPPALPPQR